MLTRKMHLMTRLPLFVLGWTCLSLATTDAFSAEPVEPPARIQRADSDAPVHSGFSDIVQAGARLFGKSPQNDGASRSLPEVNANGTSSSSARKLALSELPFDQLSPENRQKVNTLIKSVSFYRRLPKVTFAIEPDVYRYFMAHPDTAVSIWRAMKISKLQMWQTGRYAYEADTGDGSVGTLEVLHNGVDKSLVTCDGLYKSPLFAKSIEAKSLLLLQTSFSRDLEGTIFVTHRADLFVTFPSQTIDVVSRIFSPLTVTMTDRTFTEVSLFLKMMSLAMVRRPDWVEEIAGKMDGVADIRKDQVLELNAQVHSAARKRASETAVRLELIPTGSSDSAPAVGSAPLPAAAPERRGAGGTAPSARRELPEKPAAAPRITPLEGRVVDER